MVANGTEVLYKNHSNDTGSNLTSLKLAQLIQNSIVSATGNTNRGTKLRTDLLILNTTTVPGGYCRDGIYQQLRRCAQDFAGGLSEYNNRTCGCVEQYLSATGDALKISQEIRSIADAIEEAFTYPLR